MTDLEREFERWIESKYLITGKKNARWYSRGEMQEAYLACAKSRDEEIARLRSHSYRHCKLPSHHQCSADDPELHCPWCYIGEMEDDHEKEIAALREENERLRNDKAAIEIRRRNDRMGR